jgi:hypothetical protein
MAGALTISTLNDSSGVLATQNGMTGIAKAWVYFDGRTGSTATIKGSFNVSSVTYNGTGDYTINYTTTMPNANYAINATSGLDFGVYSTVATVKIDTGLPTTSSCRIITMQANTTASTSSAYVAVTVFSS